MLVFGASVANLAAKFELSGFPWHAVATAALSSEDASEATVAGERTQVHWTQAAKGSVGLTVVEGRAPAAPDEVAVGAKTRARLAKDHMDHLELAAEGGGTRRYRLVETADFPIVDYTDYDNGIWLIGEGSSGRRGTPWC